MTGGSKLRIVHCDDSPSFQLLFRHWLDDYSDLELVGSALDVRGAIETVRAMQPDVVVTDTLGFSNDPRLVRWLAEAAPDAELVVYTGYTAAQLHPETVARVHRVVTKEDDEAELVAVLRTLHRPDR